MSWGSKNENSKSHKDEIENILGASITVHGDLTAEGGFRIDGKVDGSVHSKGVVIVGETGSVKGDLSGTDIVVAGHVHGNVVASGHLEIVASGRLEGDIEAISVRIEKGGLYRGTSRMGAAASSDEVEPASPAKTGRLTTVP